MGAASADRYLQFINVVERIDHADSMQIRFTLDASAQAFADHFVDFPVVPGVLQLHWVFQLAARWVPAAAGYEIMGLKFRAPMVPAGAFDLHIRRSAAGALKFRYTSGQTVLSEGRVHFDA